MESERGQGMCRDWYAYCTLKGHPLLVRILKDREEVGGKFWILLVCWEASGYAPAGQFVQPRPRQDVVGMSSPGCRAPKHKQLIS